MTATANFKASCNTVIRTNCDCHRGDGQYDKRMYWGCYCKEERFNADDKTHVIVIRQPCPFHLDHPGIKYELCTCSVVVADGITGRVEFKTLNSSHLIPTITRAEWDRRAKAIQARKLEQMGIDPEPLNKPKPAVKVQTPRATASVNVAVR